MDFAYAGGQRRRERLELTTALLPYDQARLALSQAKAVDDDVKDILDKAEAMRVYARRAENRDLEIDAARASMGVGASQKERLWFERGGLFRVFPILFESGDSQIGGVLIQASCWRRRPA